MKKQFPTCIHETAQSYEKMFVSAGKVGAQIELAPGDLVKVSNSKYAELV